MQPYDDLREHFRRTPEEAAAVVAMDLLALSMVVATLVGVLQDRPALLWAAVVAGVGFVAWVVGIWNLVAEWRGWE